jgi:hypothetical protein
MIAIKEEGCADIMCTPPLIKRMAVLYQEAVKKAALRKRRTKGSYEPKVLLLCVNINLL